MTCYTRHLGWLFEELDLANDRDGKRRLDAAIREALGIDPGAHCPEVWAEVKKVPEDDRLAFVARLARTVDVSGSTASG